MSSVSGVHALILASGSSTRLGQPKALLRWRSECFLERIVRVLREGGVTRVSIVVGGPHQEQVQAIDVEAEWIVNPDPSLGPISSVRSGLAVTSSGYCIIHPVDIPGVEAEDVAALLEASARRADASTPRVWLPSVDRRRGHPVLFDRAVAEIVLSLPSGATLRDAWRDPRVEVCHVVRTNAWLRFDVDTPADYEVLRGRLDLEGPTISD